MEKLKNGAIKVWKILLTIFLLLAGIIVYLVSKNRSLLTKVLQGEVGKKDAVIEEKKSQLEKEQERLEQEAEDLKKMAESAKKDLKPEDVEKHWNDDGKE